MPFQSEAQRKAMGTAAGGHSTLGIPKAVGEKFLAHAKDMAPDDWNALIADLRKFLGEEAEEPEHSDVDVAGLRDRLTKFFREEEEESEHQASDVCALDKASVRSFDADGRLHVAKSNISRAAVNEYYGEEIPDWEKLGLQPKKLYSLFRDPEELKKAAKTFNNIPILSEHVPVSATSHRPELVIGSTGTDADFDGEFLTNSLVFWPQDAIDEIESGEKCELSCAYRYDPVLDSGTYKGKAYTIRMTNLIANHVAKVVAGRAGSDVVVGDSKPKQANDALGLPLDFSQFESAIKPKELNTMTKAAPTVLSRKAVLARGALLVHLRPRLAQDAKIDLTPILEKVTAKNFKASIPAISAGITAATNGKLAKDADIGDLTQLLDALEEVNEVEGIDADPNSGLPMTELPKPEAKDAGGLEKLRAYLKATGLTDEECEEACKLIGAPVEATDAEIPANIEEKKEEMVSKPAMDAAIQAAKAQATADAIRTQREIRDAEEAVRPFVGSLAMAHDSAEGVYRTALTTLGAMDEAEAKTLPLAALKSVLKAQPVPGARPAQTRIAQDSGAAQSFASRFPGADRIGNV